MSEKYPDTPAGRQAAIDASPLMDYWEEKIDYTGVHIENNDQLLIVTALAQTADEYPGFFDEEQHEFIRGLVNQIKEEM